MDYFLITVKELATDFCLKGEVELINHKQPELSRRIFPLCSSSHDFP